jgi:RNA-directed DNA polymerase
LASYFDSIPHDRLVARVEEKVSDGRVLDMRGWLKADMLKGLERWTPAQGSPQGAVIGTLLANICLDPLDAAMAESARRMVRYADDFVILCRTREEADAALAEVRAWVGENGLALHPAKTHVGDLPAAGARVRVPRLSFRSQPASRAPEEPEQVQGHIREKTRRTRGDSLACAVVDLNPLLRGWFGYFKHAHHTTFDKLDGFARRRLRAVLRKQEKRPGQGVFLCARRQEGH